MMNKLTAKLLIELQTHHTIAAQNMPQYKTNHKLVSFRSLHPPPSYTSVSYYVDSNFIHYLCFLRIRNCSLSVLSTTSTLQHNSVANE